MKYNSARNSKVSVVMPCYNHARYLVESAHSVLAQTYNDLELIIIDDCSDDNSVEIIKSLKSNDDRVTPVFHKTNMGVSRSRNDAFKVSTGGCIAFCDADDIWERDKLEVQINCLNENREFGATYSDSIIIDEKSIPTGIKFSSIYQRGIKTTGDLFLELCLTNFLNTPTVLLRKECVDDAGEFEEDFKYNEDWIYWASIAKNHKFFYIDRPLVRYRVHPKSTSHDRVGFCEHRVKGYNFILRNFPDIPGKVKSKIFYNLGVDYKELSEHGKAKEAFLKSLKINKFNFKSLLRLCLAR